MLNLKPHDPLKQIIACLNEAAEEHFPIKRSQKKQEYIRSPNIIGYNEVIRPLKSDVHNAYCL